jgi:DNA-binding XRE family transcriptional regulator
MTKRDKKKPIEDATEILDREIGDDEELRGHVAEAKLNVRIAEMIYETRSDASLTQAQLAELVGTTQSVISRLEDADYEGHSLPMLQRIAAAFHKRLDVRFEPEVA